MPNTFGMDDADMFMKSVVLEVEKRISLERFTEPYVITRLEEYLSEGDCDVHGHRFPFLHADFWG